MNNSNRAQGAEGTAVGEKKKKKGSKSDSLVHVPAHRERKRRADRERSGWERKYD